MVCVCVCVCVCKNMGIKNKTRSYLLDWLLQKVTSFLWSHYFYSLHTLTQFPYISYGDLDR